MSEILHALKKYTEHILYDDEILKILTYRFNNREKVWLLLQKFDFSK